MANHHGGRQKGPTASHDRPPDAAGPPPYGRLPARRTGPRSGTAAGCFGQICEPALNVGLTYGVVCHFWPSLMPKDHVSRFIVGLVRESLDLKAIMCSYMSGLGQPPLKRLAKIQEAMAALEADAKLAAEEERRIEAEKQQQRNAEGRKKPGKPAAPLPDEPDPKAQRNFTDPDSRIMKSKEGFVQAYNAQAAVDAEAQIIVAHELTQCGSDQGQLVPLVEFRC